MVTVTIGLLLAFVLGLLARQVGLPPLVGFLAAGFMLSAVGYETNELIDGLAHGGVLLLLFSVGLKLRLKSLLRVEVLATSLLHLLISSVLFLLLLQNYSGLNSQAALLVAVALSFSSTVIAAKVLESKKELRAFHGRVAIGILIMQDIAAVVLMSAAGSHTPSPWAVTLLGFFIARPLLHKILDWSGHEELLVLFGLMVAIVVGGNSFEYFGLSSELGALLLGVVLADHKRASELSNAMWGLKELLLIGFFLQIGLSGQPDWGTLGYAFLFALILPIKMGLFFVLLLIFRLRARNAFLASLSLATYSEFGLIVAAMGVKQGWLANHWMVLLAVTVALSFVIAAPLTRFAHVVYTRIEPYLARFESKRRHPDDEPISLGNSNVVIVGMGRVGTGAYDFFTQRERRVIGLDSDPGKVDYHRQLSRRVLYADAEDPSLWDKLNLDGVNAVMLALPDLESKKLASERLRANGFKGLIGATAVFNEELQLIKDAGADLVYNYFDEVGVGFAEHMSEALWEKT